MKKGISTAIRVLVSFGVLGGLFWIMRKDIGQIWRIILSGDLSYILAAAFFIALMVAFLSMRLKVVFHGENLFVSLKEATELTCVGFFFNNFMPTAVGGDIVKAHYAAHFNKKKMKSYASVFMDRIIGMLAILLVAAAALVFDRGRFDFPAIRPVILIFLLLGTVGIIIMTNRFIAQGMEKMFSRFRLRGLGDRLNEVYSIIHDYRNRPEVVLRSVILSVAVQIVYCVAIYFLFLSLGKRVEFGNILLIMPVVVFVSMVPSIGGLGVRESTTVVLFSVVAGKEVSFAVSMLALAGNLLISVVGGLVYMGWSFKPKPV
ncbi:MAG: lysylphosphatidylglycerol synthase transmembrane domain-containing protein [Candidatus Omnitrophota bacterium]